MSNTKDRLRLCLRQVAVTHTHVHAHTLVYHRWILAVMPLCRSFTYSSCIFTLLRWIAICHFAICVLWHATHFSELPRLRCLALCTRSMRTCLQEVFCVCLLAAIQLQRLLCLLELLHSPFLLLHVASSMRLLNKYIGRWCVRRSTVALFAVAWLL